MGNKAVLGYVMAKKDSKIYPFIEKDENGYCILVGKEENWFSKSEFYGEVEANQIQIEVSQPAIIKGVGKDSETVVNEHGGKQSKVLYRFDLCDPKAMFEMTKVLKEGFDKYGSDENWRKISVNEHLNHLLIHAYAYLAGDRSDEHLSHIMCRAMFAQGVDLERVIE